MRTHRYRIQLLDDIGGRHSDAIAYTVDGVVAFSTRQAAGGYEATIVVPDAQRETLELLLDGDDNIVTYYDRT